MTIAERPRASRDEINRLVSKTVAYDRAAPSQEVLLVADANALRNPHLPLFVMMTGLNGYFAGPASDALAESLLKAEGGGVAVWASSGMTLPAEQAVLNQELYRQLFDQAQALTLGEAVRRAKTAAGSPDIRRTWILFGDPAMRLK